ncbi:Lipoyl synthase [hydrothermal vent metagenome]|uniref:lipoyl synthase n=1 Tax=hydrothermal vent metagenome TaxID=652676 RepID=A0A3B1C3D9_9ZZZZ
MIKPQWLIKPTVKFSGARRVREQAQSDGLNTVCSSARCPNMGECFQNGVATFLILGDKCSRDCRFCAIDHASLGGIVDPDEPDKVAKAALSLGLKHIVITSVTRDDLPDGGAEVFAMTIAKLREFLPGSPVEVLTPDFQGRAGSIDTVVAAAPDVYNHNIETVPQLYETVRPLASYTRSLNLLKRVKQMAPSIVTKSGIMLGFGETKEQVLRTMKDLRDIDCDILTIGQYLQPSKKNLPVVEYIRPEVFDEYADTGMKSGFKKVFAGPFVRSSYHAGEVFASF